MEVKQISPEETYSLRFNVLWPHLSGEKNCTIENDHHPDTIHLGTFDKNRIISIGSLFKLSTDKINHRNQYRLRAMATDPEYRGKQSGRYLVEYALKLLHSKKVEVLWCDARLGAVSFYQKLGFDLIDEVYEIPVIGPHKFMWIEL